MAFCRISLQPLSALSITKVYKIIFLKTLTAAIGYDCVLGFRVLLFQYFNQFFVYIQNLSPNFLRFNYSNIFKFF